MDQISSFLLLGFEGELFITLGYGEYAPTEPNITAGGWGQSGKPTKKRKRAQVLRWSDFETSEERRIALAQALALAAEPVAAISYDPEEDSIIAEVEEEDALITALVMARIIH